MRYDGFDVGGAVRRHVLPDGFEVPPKVASETREDQGQSNLSRYEDIHDRLYYGRRRIPGGEDPRIPS